MCVQWHTVSYGELFTSGCILCYIISISDTKSKGLQNAKQEERLRETKLGISENLRSKQDVHWWYYAFQFPCTPPYLTDQDCWNKAGEYGKGNGIQLLTEICTLHFWKY